MKKLRICVLIFGLTITILCLSHEGGIALYSKNSEKEREFRGAITTIFQDEANHMAYVFQIKTATEEFDLYAEKWKYLYNVAVIGDTIIKNKGEMMVTLKKEDGTLHICPYKDTFFLFP